MTSRTPARLFSRLTPSTERTLVDVLRTERAGGILLLIGTAAALIFANTPLQDFYGNLSELRIGPHALHLDLTVAAWAKDGLLAIFFFVVGLELKREIVAGELRRPATAVVPIVAAIGGMAMPALLYVLFNAVEGGSLDGWAVPTATDIAFAIAVLAVVGKWLPNALRAFLLTLAVVDDLLAIIIIAVFFSNDLHFEWLAAAVVCIVAFGLLIRKGWASPWLLFPIAFAAWAFMHASGIHATIAGVALGMMVPAIAREGERTSLAEHWEHVWRPVSAAVAVPIFAFFAAGVTINAEAISELVSSPVAHGVIAGLVIGKPLGIVLATWLVATFTRAQLDRGLSWLDVTGMGMLAGIGFTVSLLIGDLAFGGENAEVVKLSVLTASLLAAILGASLLFGRDRFYRRLYERRSTPVPLPSNRMAKPQELGRSVGVDPAEVGVEGEDDAETAR
ncbi:Na+/H+ antiporter NhaA [Demequina gelatinilytica]|uniref:Na+/H+ antiporter NhaA n=1 Tax=Demequina gelatinilytica TaxID=1638980 RepID=UPI0009E226AD|nr:Na+/H+ antiporter NhaA [Demequina gelatinilytica]